MMRLTDYYSPVFNIFVFLQHERLKGESGEQITKLKRDIERSKGEAQELALKAEMGRLQAEEEAKRRTLRLSQQLEEMQKKQEVEVCGTISERKFTY